jgi:hypothetical protein
MAEITYAPQSSEVPTTAPLTEEGLQQQELTNKFDSFTTSPEMAQAMKEDNGANLRPFGTDLTQTDPYQQQESRVKAMLYDPVNLGGQADQAVTNSQKTTDSQGYRDQVASYAAVSHLTGSPIQDVVDNFGFYQSALEKQYNLDPTDNVGTFRTNIAGIFQQHDKRVSALDGLKSQAINDAFEDADKGIGVPSLTRFNNWQSTHEDALKGLSESERLNAFNSVYKPIQKALNTPEGALAKRFVDAIRKNDEEAKANNDLPDPNHIDPKQYLRGLNAEDQTKVLTLARQLFATKKKEGGFMAELNALADSFASSMESYGRISDVHNLINLEAQRDAATDPVAKEKFQQQYNDLLLAEKVRQFTNSEIYAPPVHYGWKGSVSKVASGVSAMVPQIVPFMVPIAGEVAFGLNEVSNQTLKRMQENPNMTAREAYERSIIPAAVSTVIGTKAIKLLGKVAPTVVGVLKHFTGSTILLSTAEFSKTLYAQLENAWNKDINAGQDFAAEYWETLKNAPYLFVELGIFGVAAHITSNGGKVDSETADRAAKKAADPLVLREQGFSSEEATRISQLPEEERLQAIADGWKARTKEDIAAGNQLIRDNNQRIVDTITAPDAPKLVHNFDGTYKVTTVDAEGKEHSATFTDKEAAESAYTMAMQDHLIEKQAKEEKDGNDWTGSTAEDAKTVLDEGRQPDKDGGVPDDIQKLNAERNRLVIEERPQHMDGTVGLRRVNDRIAAIDAKIREWKEGLKIGVHPDDASGQVLTDAPNDTTMTGDEADLSPKAENTADAKESALAIRTINQSLARKNISTRLTAAGDKDIHELSLDPVFQLADKLAGLFGKRIVFYTGDKFAPNGAQSTALGIGHYVFLKTDGARPHLFTLAHELWHHLENDSKTLAKSLRSELAPLIKDWAKLNGKYKSHGYDKDRFFDEHIADFLGDSFQDADFLNKLREKNPEAFADFSTKALEWISGVLEKLKGWTMGGTDHIRDIKAARDMLAEGLHKYIIRDDSPIEAKNSPEWWKAEPKAFGERQTFIENPIIAYLNENRLKATRGAEGKDDRPKLPPAHSTKIFGGSQTIDQAHQALVEEGLMSEDSDVKDLWRKIGEASESAIKQTIADKAETARQKEEAKFDKELADLREHDPVAYRQRLADMEPAEQKRNERKQLVERAHRANREDRLNFQNARAEDNNEVESGFYSQLQKTVADKMPNKASVEQIRAIIDPAKGSGVKPDEIKWSNLEGFLEGKKSVTKAEVLDYLKNEGAVKFEEVQKGDGTQLLKEGFAKHGWEVELDPQDGSFNYIDPEGDIIPFDDLPKGLQSEVEKASKGHGTKYEQYVLSGGENYKEVVLTMPQNVDSKRYARMEEIAELLKHGNINSEQAHELRVEYKNLSDYSSGYEGFTSNHFGDIPNYVAHMRLNERQDSTGKDGLFIEEIQSDRHQQGREKGYREDKEAEMNRLLNNRVSSTDAWKVAQDRINELGRGDVGVPDAPFRKDWSVQMFKRALRDAVASGKDWIGWTSGETQADRFDLSKKLKGIKFKKWNGGNEVEISQMPKDESTWTNAGVHKIADLPNVVGKELSEKIANSADTEGELTGLELKIEHKGMKGFYDEILPKEIGKYVKKFGTKVEAGSVPTRDYNSPRRFQVSNETVGQYGIREIATGQMYTDDNGQTPYFQSRNEAQLQSDSLNRQAHEMKQTPIWKVSITPEMADSIKESGQVHFQAATPIIKGVTPPPPTLREKTEASLTRLKSTMRDLPASSPFKKSLLKWSARSQRSTNDIERAQHDIEKVAPQQATREGITNWIEAGGDKSLLRMRSNATTDSKLKAGYDAALAFTPEQEKLAGKIKQTFDVLKKRAEAYGIEMGYRENYVPHVYKTEPQAPSGSTPKRLDEFFKFSQERTFDSYHEGEQHGYEPETKDIAKLLGLYMNDMNNAINSRRFVEELRGLKGTDGRPLVSARGSGKETTTANGTTHLVYPDAADEGTEDYKKLDQPALHDWKFAGQDSAGNNVLTKGDLAVHPEIAQHLNNALSSSAITRYLGMKSENPFHNLVKGTVNVALKTQSYVKGTMLSLSPFHQVQEGIHAIGHRVSPFHGLPKIDLRDPAQRDASEHGLMLAHDRLSQSLFMEGVGDNQSNLVTMGLRKLGWGMSTKAADTLDAYQHYLFSQYIPALKFNTYTHILERNMDRYKDDLAAGKVDEWQIKNLSARQSNAAYGHLNYTDMGHNPTIRHAAQIILLAPDFLEARARFVGQAAKGLVGGKVGTEQLQALAFLAMTQFIFARIFNKLTNDDYEWKHPFEIRVDNKYYGLRSVPEDMYKLVSNTTGFIGGRISPLFGKFVQEGVFGVNYRGERTSVGDAIGDIMAGVVPMALQPLVSEWTSTGRAHDLSWWEQILASGGVQIHRYSPITTVYPMAHDWVKANYPEDVQKGSYPVSKYQQLRYALEDNDTEKAHKEVDKLIAGGMKKHDVAMGFKSSIDHPFTGSTKHDKEFYKSLDEDDQQRYKAAVERRKEILHRFHSMNRVPADSEEATSE